MLLNPPIANEERERIARIILDAPPTVGHNVLAQETGINREMVRRIRTGDRWANVLPDLPRQSKNRNRRCTDCVNCDFLEWKCKLNIPESIADDGDLERKYAICCTNYVEDKEIACLIKTSTDDPAFKDAIQRFKDMGLTFQQIGRIVKKATIALPQVEYTTEYKRYKYPAPESSMTSLYPLNVKAAATLQPQQFTIGETWRNPNSRHYRVCAHTATHAKLLSVGGGKHKIVPIFATDGYTLVAPARQVGRF
jgi:hypothetical protein